MGVIHGNQVESKAAQRLRMWESMVGYGRDGGSHCGSQYFQCVCKPEADFAIRCKLGVERTAFRDHSADQVG